MKNWLRRVRGAIGTGLTWAVAWGALGFIPRWGLGIEGDLPFGILFAGLGFFSGLTFSVLLVLTEGRRRFDQMSLRRFAALGAAGGLVLGALFAATGSASLVDLLVIPAAFAVVCATSASGSLTLARWAARKDLPGNQGHAGAELADRGKQSLLGGGH